MAATIDGGVSTSTTSWLLSCPPPPQPPPPPRPRAPPHHHAAGQAAGPGGPRDLAAPPADPLAVQDRVHLAGQRSPLQAACRAPRRGEVPVVGPPAVGAT